MTSAQAVAAMVNSPADAMLHALPHPVIMVSADGKIADANVAAEQFFEASTAMLRRHLLRELVPFGSPLLTLIEQVRQRQRQLRLRYSRIIADASLRPMSRLIHGAISRKRSTILPGERRHDARTGSCCNGQHAGGRDSACIAASGDHGVG